MSPIFYTRAQIASWLGAHTVAKARDYQHAVANLHWQEQTLSGEILGSELHPYAVWVNFHALGADYWIENTCTCPAGADCEHVAAALIAGLTDMPKPQPGVRTMLVSWLDDFRARCKASEAAGQSAASAKIRHTIAYVIEWTCRQQPEVELYKARLGPDGTIKTLDAQWRNVEASLIKPPKFVAEQDLTILRGLWLGRDREVDGCFSLKGSTGAMIMQKLIETGRAFAAAPSFDGDPVQLRAGSVRGGRIEWQPQSDDRLKPALQTDPPASAVFITDPPWYVDAQSGEAGPVEFAWSSRYLGDYLSMPAISLAEAPLVGTVLREIAPDLPLPPAHDAVAVRVIDSLPAPVLSLTSQPLNPVWGAREYKSGGVLDFATLSFDYDDVRVEAPDTASLYKTASAEVVQIKRNPAEEKRRKNELIKAGFVSLPANKLYGPKPFPPGMLGLARAEDWPSFIQEGMPALRHQGWRVSMSEAFRFNVFEIDVIDGDLRPADDGWFDVEMGITVDQRTVRLEPLLAELFGRDPRWLGGGLDSIDDNEAIELKTDRGERLRLGARRLKPLVRTLVDLFDAQGNEPLRISALDAGRLEALNDTARWQFHGDTSISLLAQRLQTGPGVQPAAIPRGLRAELRAYQHQGLSWMQFLREHQLSGVLADDMGLGKTVQALAHILAEKEAGRLDRPALIVMPTTLVHNWREEAQRFAPDLKVLALNGPQRKNRFDQIGEHDLILTTYALLWRDHKALAAHDYHLLILDEAQYVKNVTTRAAAAIRDLRARHRLCLTGTPLENHLGELWAQFDFLLPGFLGSQKDFTKRWRTPIEKNGDNVRRQLLARRIRPFMLRRRKDEVATELPPKTTIVRSVDLEGGQRDLYETVRTAMQEKVRAVVATQGLARSHIIVLDALLKLRQVCCDPRLVRLERATVVKESAKLELLMAMLPELIAEGRRVLLFSQFTGMLTLIAAALDQAAIPYVTLTGDCTDRVTPVRRFQQGEAPLFLISLKAGGVGLNLTAADTVIHYDPWWNPAAENQATDRAHRIGQDKPVFVYKLIAAGSIEEKIVALQEKKALLANGILSEDGAASVKFSPEDIEALFLPMPEVMQSG